MVRKGIGLDVAVLWRRLVILVLNSLYVWEVYPAIWGGLRGVAASRRSVKHRRPSKTAGRVVLEEQEGVQMGSVGGRPGGGALRWLFDAGGRRRYGGRWSWAEMRSEEALRRRSGEESARGGRIGC